MRCKVLSAWQEKRISSTEKAHHFKVMHMLAIGSLYAMRSRFFSGNSAFANFLFDVSLSSIHYCCPFVKYRFQLLLICFGNDRLSYSAHCPPTIAVPSRAHTQSNCEWKWSKRNYKLTSQWMHDRDRRQRHHYQCTVADRINIPFSNCCRAVVIDVEFGSEKICTLQCQQAMNERHKM